MASFLDRTLVTSTVGGGVAVPCVLAAVVDEPDFELHETQKPILLARARPNRNL
jgi:hypothetical protein